MRSQAQSPSEMPGATRRPPAFLVLLIAGSLLIMAAGVWQLWQNNRQAESLAAREGRAEAAIRSPQPAADFRLSSLDGRQVNLSDYRGKVVLLNFWATWCPPCKAEIPDLNALSVEYGQAHNLVVVGVDAEESRDTVLAYAQAEGITYPVLLDLDGTVMNDVYGIRALPTSLIIDPTGKIRDRWSGQIPKSSMLTRLQKVW